MAALVLLSGKTVHTADNALMMLHSPMSGCQGNASDIQQVLEMLDKVQESLITCIASRKGTNADDIKAKYFD
jgi:ATP-dependent Clp protease protease subunit